MGRLEEWLDGRTLPPMDVFLRTVDIISGQTVSTNPTAAKVRARILGRRSAELIEGSHRAVARAKELQEAKRTGRQTERCLADFLAAVFGPHERLIMLESALDAAIEVAHADMGNVQLKRDDGLHIVVQRGFKEPFLEFFDRVDHEHCACGTAINAGARVVVSDVAADPIFAGTEAARVMHAAGVRAVQSTPLIATTGVVLGMLSTHYSQPLTPEAEELQDIDAIAQRAAYWLEQLTA